MVEPDESRMEQERELSAGPRKESTATSGSTFEEPPALKNNVSLSPGNNQERGVRAMDDNENASRKLFEGFSDMTKTLFSPERAKKVAALLIDNSEKAADQALKFQAKMTEWSKDTMLAPIFEQQNLFQLPEAARGFRGDFNTAAGGRGDGHHVARDCVSVSAWSPVPLEPFPTAGGFVVTLHPGAFVDVLKARHVIRERHLILCGILFGHL